MYVLTITLYVSTIIYIANTANINKEENFRDVQIELGTVRGFMLRADNNRSFISFEGVPYAEPPIGNNRFNDPVPKKPWWGVWFANTTVSCLQYTELMFPYRVTGQEDCLYLNIYTLEYIPKGKLLDVIIHIHGGAFMFGDGHQWKPFNIMKYDVVYVSINYRLGPLGFLSTEDDVVPGNNGMKDQVMALKWIKKYIECFGGNPNSISLTGLSAGGASVLLHLVSPLSKGLFKNAFALSGSFLNPWAQAEAPLQKAKKLAANVGCNTQSNLQMVNCLRQRPAHQIVAKVPLFLAFLYNPFSPWAPVVEKTNNKNAFLNRPFYDALANGYVQDVPLILSVVEGEGLYPGAEFIRDNEPPYLQTINDNWDNLARFILDFNYTLERSEQPLYSERIRKFYIGDKPISNETFPQLIKMMTDRLFIKTIEETLRILVTRKKQPIYFQYFTYLGPTSLATAFSRKNNTLAPAHADDLNYVLVNNPPRPTEDNIAIQNILTEIWLSFARDGHPRVPNTEFKPVVIGEDNKFNFLEIASPNDISMKRTQTLTKSFEFWNEIPFWENKKALENQSGNF